MTCHLKRPYRYSKEVKRLVDFVDFVIAHQTFKDANLDISGNKEPHSNRRPPSGSTPTWLIGGTNREVMEEVARESTWDFAWSALPTEDLA